MGGLNHLFLQNPSEAVLDSFLTYSLKVVYGVYGVEHNMATCQASRQLILNHVLDGLPLCL